MTYKTILAVFQNETDTGSLLESATTLAKATEARVFGFHPEIIPTSFAMASGFPDIEIVHDATERAMKATSAIEAHFERHVAASGINAQWVSGKGFPGDFSAGALTVARSCDLVVTTQPNPDTETVDIDNLLQESGRPVLVLPREPLKDASFRKVIVGWNGSREAARATFDALPFLKRAEAVELLVLDPEARGQGAPQQGEAITATLARHGVNVTRIAAKTGSTSIENAILGHAVAGAADLLVLGAYGHSWLREFLFGGVTRSVMESTPIPTLMSH